MHWLIYEIAYINGLQFEDAQKTFDRISFIHPNKDNDIKLIYLTCICEQASKLGMTAWNFLSMIRAVPC